MLPRRISSCWKGLPCHAVLHLTIRRRPGGAACNNRARDVCRYVGAQRGDSQLVRLSATPIGGSEAPPGGSPTFLEVGRLMWHRADSQATVLASAATAEAPSRDALQLADLRPVLQVLESYTNLGPIVDFVVMDLERQGQGQVCDNEKYSS